MINLKSIIVGNAEVKFLLNRKVRTANIYVLDTDMKEDITKRVVSLLYKLGYGRKSVDDIFIINYYLKEGYSISKTNNEHRIVKNIGSHDTDFEQLQLSNFQ